MSELIAVRQGSLVEIEPGEVVPWEAVITSFLDTLETAGTRRTYEPTIRRMADFLGGRGPAEAGADLVASWARSVRESVEAGEISPNTGKKRIMAAKSFFRFAHSVGQSNIGKDLRRFVLKPPKERVQKPFQTLNEEEEARLLEVVNGRHRQMLATMLYAGLRASEVCRLKRTDYYKDADGRRWLLVHGKGGEGRQVPVGYTLAAYLGEPGGNGEPLFQSRQGNGFYHRTRLFQIVQQAIEDAGIGRRISPHSLRHTAAVRWIFKDKVPLSIVQKWLGHKSLATTQKYLDHIENSEAHKYMK